LGALDRIAHAETPVTPSGVDGVVLTKITLDTTVMSLVDARSDQQLLVSNVYIFSSIPTIFVIIIQLRHFATLNLFKSLVYHGS
jgi:hypothetical protein